MSIFYVLVLAWIFETALVASGLAICFLRHSRREITPKLSIQRDKLTSARGAPI